VQSKGQVWPDVRGVCASSQPGIAQGDAADDQGVASAMVPIWHHMNLYLMRWLKRKHRRFARRTKRAIKALERMARAMPNAFVHWKAGYIPKGWIMGAG